MTIINLEEFEFKQEQMQAMFLSKLIPVLIDIERTKPGVKKDLLTRFEYNPHQIKIEWRDFWWNRLQGLVAEPYRLPLPESSRVAAEQLAQLTLSPTQKRIVLISLADFREYYRQAAGDVPKVANLNKVSLKEAHKTGGEYLVADALGIAKNKVTDLHGLIGTAKIDYEDWLKRTYQIVLSGGFAALFLWAAAPVIGAFIGTAILGLNGVAAVTGGLAWLAGGALAAGGLGMAGGTTIIAGVGALLGFASGGLATKILHTDKTSAIRNALQLEMLISGFILSEKDGYVEAYRLYDQARDSYQKIFCLRDDVELNNPNSDVSEIVSQMKTETKVGFSEKKLRAELAKGLNESLLIYEKMLDRIRAKLMSEKRK